ncbi:dihydrofolate reductase [Lactobacillus ultunensis]|uniref:Dihydrofolate reductase n=1 Tax=Lactobacillus ultunensis DSM 16047 TaxID=525365 RepID=C2EMP9_9LACO|nr:dihydrofolate reductase [Lactobacillus ultunensis]EEJ72258.1 dihydrofolate reductase [Lactobacillus ultunensis DSM 16047]KRL82895.1 dihydrofolate reductase [Lactobacillus ultunensis DSM 16047]QQP27808.1 dihydrofolate reductase [Lactobacillus ultunensis]
MIEYVWAEDKKHQIGVDGHLPWHLPADLKHFKEETINHPIIMGRKTFASLPRLLPKRKHIVLTHNEDLKKKYQTNDQVIILASLEELNQYLQNHRSEKICAIGGVSIFKALIDQVDILAKTEIDGVFSADTVMPEIDYDKFKLIKKEAHPADEKNKFPYTFLTYVRKH